MARVSQVIRAFLFSSVFNQQGRDLEKKANAEIQDATPFVPQHFANRAHG
jgi:hypothetical protein